jgi:hypothetical protein
MSGGAFDYNQYKIEDIARKIQALIESNDDQTPHQYGGTVGNNYSPAIIAKFAETVHTLKQAAEMAQRVDWLVSGDDGEESFLSRWAQEVRPYWNDTKQEDTP